MLISLNWINDFSPIPDLSPEKITEDFTLSTAEVEEFTHVNNHLSQIIIAKVDEVRPHPEADRLRLVKFQTGDGQREVVCGAPNVRPGITVAYAPIGVTLPNGLTLEARKIRGVLSEGMLCSPDELGVGEDADGIWELPDDAPLGTTLAEFLKSESDIIIDVDNKSLTHRPDLWGHFGIAREFSAIYESELQDRFDETWEKKLEAKCSKDPAPITVSVKSDTSCLGYFGLTVENVQVTESPLWMQQRLTAVGLRPINNMVDIGNYVMLELGIPMHIFDKNKIGDSKIIVRRAKEGQKLAMLDESTAELEPDDTVVADGTKPLVVAGIMGGAESGV